MSAASGKVACKHGHLHVDAAAARVCEVAWQQVLRKRLRTDELVAELRQVLKLERSA